MSGPRVLLAPVGLGALALWLARSDRAPRPDTAPVYVAAAVSEADSVVGRPASPAIPAPRAAVEDAVDRLARAETVRDVLAALGIERAPRSDARV